MKAELRIELNVDNAAFEENGIAEEIQRIITGSLLIERFAAEIEAMTGDAHSYASSHALRDSYGNTVGQFTIQISEVE